MKKAYKILISVMFVHLCICAAFSQQASKVFSSEKIARLDSFMQVMADNNMFNGSVLVAQKGQVVYKRSAGYYNMEKNIFNGTNTPFNLASLSKPFTSLAVLQLVQNKKLYFTDPISKYFADFPFHNITIKHLLTHTSGLPSIENVEAENIRNYPYEIISNLKAYKDLIAYTDTLVFEPGEKFQYNNANYFLLSLIIEKASGLSFADYMTKKIFQPAGMKNTYIRQEKSNTPRYIFATMFASKYEPVDSLDQGKFYTYFQLGQLQGPNNVISTANDLFLFDNALNLGILVDTGILAEAYAPAILNNGKKPRLGGGRTYGMGWNIIEDSTKAKVVFHDGHIIGLTTMMYKNLAKGQTIIFYDNTESPAFFQKVGTIARILNDEPLNKISLKKSAVRAFGQLLVSKGLEAASERLNVLRADSNNYYFDELEMNTLGYDLLSHAYLPEHKALSMDVFKMNTLLFPTHSNVYDSYGDALRQNGLKEEAIIMYKKALEVDPNNKLAKANLEGLRK
jgi:CubicO group peptidase (beta-lactamase class C family)